MGVPSDIGEDGMTSEDAPIHEVETKYKLSLEGEGVTVEREVSADVAREIIAVVMSGIGRDRGPRAAPIAGSPRPTARVSVREFMDTARAKKNPQIVSAIGIYLTDHEGQERFTRGEVKQRFSDAGEPTPANISRDFALAKASGWIAENPRNEFYVTDSGRRAVEAGFEGFRVRRPRRPSTKRRAEKSKES
jgi:hypothetical protein